VNGSLRLPPVRLDLKMVGTGRFELPTCRLGGGRSIHLSYVPIPNYILILNHFEFQLILSIIFLPENVSKRYQNILIPPWPYQNSSPVRWPGG
jgi:hypothetical protein